jgi:hypothetical protein
MLAKCVLGGTDAVYHERTANVRNDDSNYVTAIHAQTASKFVTLVSQPFDGRMNASQRLLAYIALAAKGA